VSRKGGIAYGVFPFHDWHKKESEDIVGSVGLKVACEEELQQPLVKGTFKTVRDKEHAEIIRLYIEEEMGMPQIAQKLDRSTRTPHSH
jgi:hypothetical protein